MTVPGNGGPRLVGWVALAERHPALHDLGRGALGPPPLSSGARSWQPGGDSEVRCSRPLPPPGRSCGGSGATCVVLWTLAALARWRRSDGVIRHLLRWRLPGTRTVVRASIGVSALGATLLSNAGPGVAAGRGSPGGAGRPSLPRPPCCATPARRPGIPRAAAPRRPPRHCATPARPFRPRRPCRPPTRQYDRGRPDTRHRFPATTPECERQRPARHPQPTGSQPPPASRAGPARHPPPVPSHHPPARADRPDTRHRFPATTRQHERGRPDSRHRFAATICEHSKRRAPTPVTTSAAGAPTSYAAFAETLRLDSDAPFPRRSRPVRRAATADGEAGSAATWRVSPGDSLWSIAEATLATAWGQAPDERDLAHYWWQVVQTNRPFLPIPADPNLLFPGDQVVIPPPPAAPAGRVDAQPATGRTPDWRCAEMGRSGDHRAWESPASPWR